MARDPRISIPHTLIKKDLYGIFRPEGIPYGANGIRKKLCKVREYEYRAGNKKRSSVEIEKYVGDLYTKKLEEILTTEQNTKKDLSIKEASELWLDSLRKKKVKANTIKHYNCCLNWYFNILPNHSIHNFKKDYYDELVSNIQGTPATVNSYLGAYSRLYLWLLNREYITKRIEFPRIRSTKKQPRIYKENDLDLISQYLLERCQVRNKAHRIMAINAYRYHVMASNTGMRPGEIWALPLSCIDMQERVIYIRDQQMDSSPTWTVKERKEKTIPINDTLYMFLKKEQRRKAEVFYLDKGNGTRHWKTVNCITHAYYYIKKEVGIGGQKPLHGYRSTVLTKVIQVAGIAVAQEIAGHSDISTTKMYYADDQKINRDALNKISDKNSRNSQ